MDEAITIVSGLPRSGTSMMMRMLHAGGLDVMVDHIRKPDEDNPAGYYEYERVKKIKEDTAWLEETRGKLFKMVSMLLMHLPASHRYKVVFMRREMGEVLASQRKMLARLGRVDQAGSDDKMAALFGKHLGDTESWLARQPNFEVLYVNYRDVLESPRQQADRLAAFLKRPLNIDAMTAAVDHRLYRNRTHGHPPPGHDAADRAGSRPG
jgi:hypothetical protein